MLCNIFMPGELFSFLPFIRKINFPFYIQILVLNFALFARFLTSVCLKSFKKETTVYQHFFSVVFEAFGTVQPLNALILT